MRTRRIADQKVSDMIIAIRAKYGSTQNVACPTCGRHPDRPFRRIVNGKIVEGCVDAIHGRALIAPSGSYDWHNRTDAKMIRALILESLKA